MDGGADRSTEGLDGGGDEPRVGGQVNPNQTPAPADPQDSLHVTMVGLEGLSSSGIYDFCLWVLFSTRVSSTYRVSSFSTGFDEYLRALNVAGISKTVSLFFLRASRFEGIRAILARLVPFSCCRERQVLCFSCFFFSCFLSVVFINDPKKSACSSSAVASL